MEYLQEASGFNQIILRRQYGYFKDKPGKDLVETRVKLMTLKPDANISKLSQEQSSWDSLNAPDDISTEKYLQYHLGDTLRSAPVGECLRICFLVLNVGTTQHQLSIWHSAIETFRGCQQDLSLAPARVIAQYIESVWALRSVSKPITLPLTSHQLPSRIKPRCIGVLPRYTEKTYNFHWQSDLLTYTNDLNIYVWQPHLERTPSACYNSVTVVIPSQDLASQTNASSAHRLFVVANPPGLMPRFSESKNAFVKSDQTQHAWDADHEKLRILAIFFKWMVEDSSKLVDDMIFKAKKVTYKGRRMPTRSKIQYLIHLEDCRRLAISDLKHGKTVVDEARSTVEMADFCCKKQGGSDEVTALKTFSGFQADFEFLIMKFEALEISLSTAREQINEQMSLAQGQRALILTIAAAFFIPLSFVASIFGMNVKEPLFPPSKSKHAPTTTATTQAITSTPTTNIDASDPSQHYWTMSQYLEISLPLTVGAILLPLIAGPWLRLASQQYEVHRRHWRALFVLFSACYFVGLFVAFYVKLGILVDGGFDVSTVIYLVASYSVSGSIGIARTVSAYRNNEGRLRWSLLLLAVAPLVVVDLLSTGYVPYAIFLFVYMFLTSEAGVRYWRRTWAWLSWKNKRQSAATQNLLGTIV